MSRVGRNPITVPSSVTVTLEGPTVSVKGPQGTLARTLPEGITIAQDGDTLVVSRPDDERRHRALHGLSRSLVANMVSGVTEGFSKELEIVGVGYRATAKGPSALELALGFSHPVQVDAPEGITFEVPVPDPDRGQGHRQGKGRPGGRRYPQAAQARALQGQGRPLRQRACAAQGWKGSEVMARTSDRTRLRIRRHDRVRAKVTGTPERPRLAVHRSNRHISAQLIDDTTGRTLAAASTVSSPTSGRNWERAAAVTSRAPNRLDTSSARGPRRQASPKWSSTAGDSCTTGGSPPWLTRRGPRDWSSKWSTHSTKSAPSR